MFRKPPTTTPSLDDRFNTATATADAALSVFAAAAASLEQSADELDVIETEAEAARIAHANIRDAALREALSRRAQAQAIRNLVGGAA